MHLDISAYPLAVDQPVSQGAGLRSQCLPQNGPRSPADGTALPRNGGEVSRSFPAAMSSEGEPPVPGLTVAAEEPTVDMPWSQKLLHCLDGYRGMGYGFSLLFHAGVLLVLLALSFQLKSGSPGVLSVGSLSEQDEDLALVELDTRVELPGEEEPQAASAPEMQLVPPGSSSPLTADVSEQLGAQVDSAFQEGATGRAAGGGRLFAKPAGSGAVTKGSFTAWTIPADPQPGESYYVVLEIRIPKELKDLDRYPLNDLTGWVRGTDGYQKSLPGRKGFLPIADGRAQLTVYVPGAERLVEDEIEIRSMRLLDEQQILKIVF